MTSASQKRPHRQRKGDRLLNPGATQDEIRIDHAVAPFDRLARKMDRKWGIDRLPELVSVETAERYGRAIGKLNAAIESGNPEVCAHQAQVCMRGLAFLDQEATESGEQEASPDIWEFDLNGKTVAILRNGEAWPALKEARPDLEFFTLREAAVALAFFEENKFVAEAKANFPNATAVGFRPRTKLEEELDDEIPF